MTFYPMWRKFAGTGSCPLTLTEFWLVQSHYVQVMRSPILAALLHGTPAASVSRSLGHCTGNEITRLSQRTPPIFGRAAITLGIGPHSSSFFPCLILVVGDWMSTIFYTWYGLSASLECRSEMCCTQLAGHTGCKNDAKKLKLPSAHHRTTLSGCIFANKARIENRKKLVKQQICPPYVVTIWQTSAH